MLDLRDAQHGEQQCAQPKQLPEQAHQQLRQEQDEHVVPGVPEQVLIAWPQPFAGGPGKNERSADITQHDGGQAPGLLQPPQVLETGEPATDTADQHGQAQYQPACATLQHRAAQQLQVQAGHRHRDTQGHRQAEPQQFTLSFHGGEYHQALDQTDDDVEQ